MGGFALHKDIDPAIFILTLMLFRHRRTLFLSGAFLLLLLMIVGPPFVGLLLLRYPGDNTTAG